MTTTWRSSDDVVTLLEVSAKLVLPVELHVAVVLSARKEWAVVLLEVAATVTCTKVDGITAELRTEETTVGEFHSYCLDGFSERQRQGESSISELNVRSRLGQTRGQVLWNVQNHF